MDIQTKTKLILTITALLALIALLCIGSAEVVQPNDDFWYLDEANVLSEATEGEIFFANQRLYDACGAEIVVVAIDSTGNMAIDDYVYTLFNNWEIGGNTYRGMLLLMAIEDDNYYVMPGTNMGNYFDSATIREMLDKYLEPSFSRKDYDQGTRLFFEAVYEKIADDLNLNLSIADAKADYEAFTRSSVQLQQEPHSTTVQTPYNYDYSAHIAHRGENLRFFSILFVMLMALLIVVRSLRRHPRHSTYTDRHSMLNGFILGKMTSNRRKYHFRGPIQGQYMNFRPTRGPGNMHHPPSAGSSFGGSFSRQSTRGFGGASRSGSFSNASRSSSRSSGFGGASRSSGNASRGPSTRGGGSGRFSR